MFGRWRSAWGYSRTQLRNIDVFLSAPYYKLWMEMVNKYIFGAKAFDLLFIQPESKK